MDSGAKMLSSQPAGKSIVSELSVQSTTSKPSEEVSSEYRSPNVIVRFKRFPAVRALARDFRKCFTCPFFSVSRMVSGGLSEEGKTMTVELADIDRLSDDMARGKATVFVNSLGSAV